MRGVRPNPAVNSDVPVKVFVLVDLPGGTPVTWIRWAATRRSASNTGHERPIGHSHW
jgi:hypothetical protein